MAVVPALAVVVGDDIEVPATQLPVAVVGVTAWVVVVLGAAAAAVAVLVAVVLVAPAGAVVVLVGVHVVT